MSRLSKQDILLFILAGLYASVLFFLCLGHGGIPAAQEGRTAIIVQNMLRTGNYVDMQIKGGVLYEKPVGHYWLCVPSAAVLTGGKVNLENRSSEWAFRLPSALSALAALAAAMLLAFRIYGARTSILTCFILSTMVTFLHLGRLAHIDMPLCASYAWAMAFLYIGYWEHMKSNAWIYGFYVMLGWGLLLKGPLVVILAGLTILVLMCCYRRWKMIWELRPLTGALVFLIVGIPWYIAEFIYTHGAFFDEFIMKQNISRFTGLHSTYRNGERMSLFYYIPKLFAGAAPWSAVSLAAFLYVVIRSIRQKKWPGFSPGSSFLLIWFLTAFVFFSLSALKRGDYLLPLYPALGILTAEAVRRGSSGGMPPLNRKYWIPVPIAAAVFLILVLSLSLSGVLIRFAQMRLDGTMKFIGHSDANNLLLLSSWGNTHVVLTIAGMLIFLSLLVFLGYLMQRGRYRQVLTLLIVCLGIGFAVYAGYADPVSGDQYRSVKSVAAQARQTIPEQETVLVCGDFNTELLYFLDRPYELKKDPEKFRFLVTDDRYAGKLMKKDPDAWQIVCRTGENHQYPAVILQRIKP